MTTTIQPRTDITPVETIRRPRRAASERERTRLAVHEEITDVEWLLPYATPAEVAQRVGRASAAALIRWLIRVERWDLAILCGPRPVDPEKIVQVSEDLAAARWRVADRNRDGIAWAIAWAAAPGVVAREVAELTAEQEALRSGWFVVQELAA